MKEKENAIEVSHITKSFKVYLDKGRSLKEIALFSRRRKYEVRKVIDDISFNVKKGEVVALIGHNGCGKSTTLKLLTKIMYPDSGSIQINGRVSSLIELGAGFHPDMSGRENIYINASIFGLTKSEIDARLDDIISFSELGDYIDNPVRTYSSGMYMRLAFSVAINVDADILLIDEILAVGDANFQAKCYERMLELKAEGVTIVLVTHDTGTVKTFCNRAIWINGGKIAAEGKSIDVVNEYLAYMNQERIEQIQQEKMEEAKKAQAKEQTSQSVADSTSGNVPVEEHIAEEKTGEDKAGGSPEKLTMDPAAKHFGNQKAVIVSCDFLDEDMKPIEVLDSAKKWYLKYKIRINEPMDELIIGMGIYTLDGFWLFGTNSLLAGQKINVRGKTEEIIIFECSPLRLHNGKYILQVAIEEANTTPCDFYYEYKKFNLFGPWNNEAGVFHYDTSWEQE